MSEGTNKLAVVETGVGGGKPVNQRQSSPLGQGVCVHHVKNLELAVCLLSIGVRLRTDPPFTHVRLTNGQDDWTFNFEEKDEQGQFKTDTLIKAFSQDMAFIEKNPVHPMTFAMCAVKNLASFKEFMARNIPYVGFKAPHGEATLYVKEGSKKHKNCVAKGMVRANPGGNKR